MSSAAGIDAAVVLALARERGHEWVDAAAAARIALGATAAVDAVTATMRDAPPGLFADAAAGFPAMLDALAEPSS